MDSVGWAVWLRCVPEAENASGGYISSVSSFHYLRLTRGPVQLDCMSYYEDLTTPSVLPPSREGFAKVFSWGPKFESLGRLGVREGSGAQHTAETFLDSIILAWHRWHRSSQQFYLTRSTRSNPTSTETVTPPPTPTRSIPRHTGIHQAGVRLYASRNVVHLGEPLVDQQVGKLPAPHPGMTEAHRGLVRVVSLCQRGGPLRVPATGSIT